MAHPLLSPLSRAEDKTSMSTELVSGIVPQSAQHALELVKAAAGLLQSAAVCLEDNLQDLTSAERRELEGELEIMRVFQRNLEACSNFERHVAAL